MIPFLPKPRILKIEGRFHFEKSAPLSIGKLRTYYGNFGAIIRAYGYIKALGIEGLKGVSENAILNANYLKVCLKKIDGLNGF